MLARSKYGTPIQLGYSYPLQFVAIIDDYGRFVRAQLTAISFHFHVAWEAIELSLPNPTFTSLFGLPTLY